MGFVVSRFHGFHACFISFVVSKVPWFHGFHGFCGFIGFIGLSIGIINLVAATPDLKYRRSLLNCRSIGSCIESSICSIFVVLGYEILPKQKAS